MARSHTPGASVRYAIAAVCLLLVGSASAVTTLEAPNTDTLTGSISDYACDCGWITSWQVGTYDGAVAALKVQCSDGATYTGTTNVAGTDITWGAWSAAAADGVSGLGATAANGAIATVGSGTDLACPAGEHLTGVQTEAFVYDGKTTQKLIEISISCAKKEEVACEEDQPAPCDAGSVRDASDNKCKPCDPGMYHDTVANECKSCPEGYAQALAGQTSCSKCQPGTFAASEGHERCTDAPAGSYTNTEGASEVQWCGPGTVSAPNRQGCVDCPPGFFRDGVASPNSNSCRKVSPGHKANAATAATAQELCPAGTVASWTDTSVPTDWSADMGAVGAKSDKRLPLNAPTQCTPCTGNTYVTLPGSMACLTCRAGFAPSKTGSLQTGCEPCQARYYKPTEDLDDSCNKCGPGFETRVDSGATTCTPCAPGYVNPADENDATLAKFTTCVPCEKNYYQPEAGQTQCQQCGAGQGTDGTGATDCNDCPLGSYSTAANSPCVLAPAGSFVGSAGATSPTQCQPGTFSADAGNAECDACPAGTFSNTAGATGCTKTPAGFFSKAGALSATPCPQGTFSKAGSRKCTPCAPGTFAKNTGQAACTPAPEGSFAAGSGNKKATPCPKGTFQAKPGQPNCLKCGKDKFQAMTGKTTCNSCCKAGTELNKTCFLWTRGLKGQAKCVSTRLRQGSL